MFLMIEAILRVCTLGLVNAVRLRAGVDRIRSNIAEQKSDTYLRQAMLLMLRQYHSAYPSTVVPFSRCPIGVVALIQTSRTRIMMSARNAYAMIGSLGLCYNVRPEVDSRDIMSEAVQYE